MKRSVSMLALLCTTALLLSADDPDNRPEVRQARLLVREQVDLNSQAIRQGANLDQLSGGQMTEAEAFSRVGKKPLYYKA